MQATVEAMAEVLVSGGQADLAKEMLTNPSEDNCKAVFEKAAEANSTNADTYKKVIAETFATEERRQRFYWETLGWLTK